MIGGTRSYEMAKRMVDAGHEVHMITSWRGLSEHKGWSPEIVEGIHVHWLNVPYQNKMGILQRLYAFFNFALRSGRKAARIGGDVVFATSTPLTIAFPGVYAARRSKCPMVFEVRDLWPELPIAIGALKNPVTIAAARWLEHFSYVNSKHVVALSPGMADGVKSNGYPADQISTIPNSCDNDLFKPDREAINRFRYRHPELGDGPIVLYAGTFGQMNGVCFLPELAARLKNTHPKLRFVAIGSGAESSCVRGHAARLGVLNENYFQYDALPKRELIGAFQAATISCSLFIDLPEMWNNSANKFFDTLASGTAIAINYYGWQAQLIEKEGIGVVLGPDVDTAAKRLSQLFDEPTKMEEMGKKARHVAERDFDRDKLAAQLIAVLENAVEDHDQV